MTNGTSKKRNVAGKKEVLGSGVKKTDAIKTVSREPAAPAPIPPKESKQKEPPKKTREKQQSKDPMEDPLPGIFKVETDELLSYMLTTQKRGLFGSREGRLRKDIMKRLGVGKDEAFARGTLLMYSRFADIKKAIAPFIKTSPSSETETSAAKTDTSKVVAEKTSISPAVVAGADAEASREKTKKKPGFAFFPRPRDSGKKEKKEKEAKAQKDSGRSKAENLGEKKKGGFFGRFSKKDKKQEAVLALDEKAEAPKPENAVDGRTLDYKFLERKRSVEGWADAREMVSEPKTEKISLVDIAKPQRTTAVFPVEKVQLTELSKTKKPEELLVREPDARVQEDKVYERMKFIERAMGEQKEYAAVEEKKKEKKRRMRLHGGMIKKPFVAARNAINAAFAKVAHAVFVAFTTVISVPIDLVRFISRAVGGFLQSIYRRVGGFSPFGWKKKITQLVIYSGIDKTQEELTGMTVVNGVILGAVISLIGFFLFNTDPIFTIILGLIGFGIMWIIVYSILNLMADKRADEVEGALPDVLQIVSANISAGMTPYNALWVSARKEFGALAEEIRIAQKETLGGKPFTTSLTEMGTRVRSNVLQRTLRLLIQGMKAGGELPNILQGIGTDIRQMRLLQREMAANTMSYVMFILFGMLIGAPLLFSVSIQFVDVINRFQPEEFKVDEASMSGAPDMGGGMQGFNVMSLGGGSCPKDFDGDGIPDKVEKVMGLNPKKGNDSQGIDPDSGKTYLALYMENPEPESASCVTPNYLSIFATLALSSIALFGSILIGLIRTGRQSSGLKLIPMLLLATLGMFWMMRFAMSFFFGSMFS